MIGAKHHRELMDEVLSRSPQDVLCEDNSSESEEPKHDPPQKRQKTSDTPSNFSFTIKNDELLAKHVIFVSQTDAEVI
jgi:hypothetical protein